MDECVHHWIIDSACLGKCKKCEEEKQFRDNYTLEEWRVGIFKTEQAKKAGRIEELRQKHDREGAPRRSASLESLRRDEEREAERDYRSLRDDEGGQV